MGAPQPAWFASRFQPALRRVGVLVVRERRSDDPVRDHVALLHHLAHIDVLYRVIVGVEAELAADRIEIRLLECCSEGLLVLHARLFKRGEDQPGRIVGLRGVDRRQPVVLGPERRDKGLVGRVIQILRP